MKKKYRLQWHIRLFLISMPILMVVLEMLTRPYFKKHWLDFIPWVCIALTIVGVIDGLISYHTVDDKGIKYTSILKSTEISWGEIWGIALQPPVKLYGFPFIGVGIQVISQNKKIGISPWTKDYKELLESVFSEYESRNQSKKNIDRRVIEHFTELVS